MMWPSEYWASKLYDLANLGLIVGLVVGIFSTVLVVWMGNVKEAYLKTSLAATNERANQLGKDLATENKTIAELQIAASEQQERAAKAERNLLRLRQEVAPRRLSGEQKAAFAKMLKDIPSPVAIVSSLLDGESSDFADDFNSAFKEAGWQTYRIGNHTAPDRGVEIGVVHGTSASITPFVARIGTTLTAIRISYHEVEISSDDHTTSPWFQVNVIYLIIGHKPEVSVAPND